MEALRLAAVRGRETEHLDDADNSVCHPTNWAQISARLLSHQTAVFDQRDRFLVGNPQAVVMRWTEQGGYVHKRSPKFRSDTGRKSLATRHEAGTEMLLHQARSLLLQPAQHLVVS